MNESKKVIDPLKLANLLRFEAEVESHQSKIMALLVQRDAYIKEIDKEGKLQRISDEILKLKGLSDRSQQSLAEVAKDIEEELGVTLSDHTFNDRTGELTEKTKE